MDALSKVGVMTSLKVLTMTYSGLNGSLSASGRLYFIMVLLGIIIIVEVNN